MSDNDTPKPDTPAEESADWSAAEPTRSPQRGCLYLLLGAVGLSIVLGFGYKLYQDHQLEAKREAHEAKVIKEIAPHVEKLTEQVGIGVQGGPDGGPSMPATKGPGYNIDKTIRVINEIDLAIKDSKDFKSYVTNLGTQDYRDVAPEILQARKELLDIVLELYTKQVELEDQEVMWEVTSEMFLTVLTAVKVDADMTGPGFAVDRQKFEQSLAEMKERHKEQRIVMEAFREVEKRFLTASLKYSEVYYKYIAEWDKLCVLRDRAYLAAHNHDWERTLTAADAAIKQAPDETEAHLLKALALIELGRQPEQQGKLVEANTLLRDFIQKNPDSTAPAFLLLGVQNSVGGNTKEATLALQQSSTYYPRQAEHLQNMLNPYKQREFLRKSREGNFILGLYKGTMLGSGYFSPDLQQARILFEQDNFEAGRQKVLDHFSRRRAQKQWDFIVSDLEFCARFLGAHWRRIFPEETYLDLEVSPSMIGSKVSATINNRSDRTLRNATLILCIRFTDMHRDDYETFIAGDGTVPQVAAKTKTDFGSAEVESKIFGDKKTTGDIVQHRAILISDEAVSWVDTDEYKIAEFAELRKQRWYQHEQKTNKSKGWTRDLGVKPNVFEKTINDNSALNVKTSTFGKDNVHIELPAQFAVLRPLFRLARGGETFTPETNILDSDRIRLTFKSVENFDGKDLEKLPIDLKVQTMFGDINLEWTPGEDGSFKLTAVEPPSATP